MAKKRKHDPKDINELVEICYGSDYSRKKKYQDLIISDDTETREGSTRFH